jgi:hydrogenase expression/formation protein HypE
MSTAGDRDDAAGGRGGAGPTAVPGAACPLPFRDDEVVSLGHGGGGVLTRELLETVFLPALGNPVLRAQEDAGVVELPAGDGAGPRLAIATDCHVVQPLFFPGGSIGELAVHGTVNDLAMVGAEPRYLTAGFIIEEGLPIAVLRRVVERMGAAARAAGVAVVAGDTKVVERGRGDGLAIATTGVGVVRPGVALGAAAVGPGDAVLVSGMLGDHGMAVMSVRESLGFETEITSDTAPLHGLVAALLAACPGTRMLRDPTRGGVAATLAEIATAAGVGIEIDEEAVPVRPAVVAACELLGIDPLTVASEGRCVAIVPAEAAATALAALRAHALGRDAVRVGRVVPRHPGVVSLVTRLGGSRVVPLPLGEHLPRIC